MLPAPIPDNDAERLAALYRLRVLDTMPERAFDDIASLAGRLLDVPGVLVSLIDRERQWCKARRGVDMSEAPRDTSLCAYVVADREPLVLTDARTDARFADNPLVGGERGIVFYAGVPLMGPDGLAVGTLCVIDHKPRELTADQVDALSRLARLTHDQLELRLQLLIRDENLRRQQALDAEKDDFIATVNHELRTPLTAVSAALQLIRRFANSEQVDRQAPLLDTAQRSVGRLRAMIDDLLDIQKLGASATSMQIGPYDAAALVTETVADNHGFAATEGIALIGRDADAPCPATGDAARLRQILDNLVSNAIKHAPAGSEVFVHLARADDALRIAVTDRGPGVPADWREQIFGRFTQAPVPVRSHHKATGLGLPIARQIARLHGGDIEVDDNPGGGARFTLVVPVAARVVSSRPVSAPAT